MENKNSKTQSKPNVDDVEAVDLLGSQLLDLINANTKKKNVENNSSFNLLSKQSSNNSRIDYLSSINIFCLSYHY